MNHEARRSVTAGFFDHCAFRLMRQSLEMPLNLAHVAASPEVTDEEVVRAFADILCAMRGRGIIRTKNVVGDLGERYAVQAYARWGPRGPITLRPANTHNVDAVDPTGGRYAIKAVSPGSTRTSAFHLKRDRDSRDAAFDYVVIVRVDEFFQPRQVTEFTWAQFWDSKSWSDTQEAWYLPLTRKVLRAGRVIL